MLLRSTGLHDPPPKPGWRDVARLGEHGRTEAPAPTIDASLLEITLRTGLRRFVLAKGRVTDASTTSETLAAVGLKVPWTG